MIGCAMPGVWELLPVDRPSTPPEAGHTHSHMKFYRFFFQKELLTDLIDY
jgi:hypothetical protein